MEEIVWVWTGSFEHDGIPVRFRNTGLATEFIQNE
jgi:hypothetical protein